MKTIKRTIPEVDTSLKSYNKYFNQMEWKGIVDNKNLFDVDQYSLNDALNVYVDDNNSLVSRDPLQDESMPEGSMPEGGRIVEIKTFGDYTVYVMSVDSDSYYIVWIDAPELEQSEKYLRYLNSYQLSSVEHYIICFNDINAKVFDINQPDKGWQNLTDLADIPITKRVVGGVETEYPNNGFTDAYKEQYVWSNQSQPELPDGTAEVEINTGRKKIEWTIPNTNILIDYRILRPLNVKVTDSEYHMIPRDLITVEKGIICIGRDDHFLISYDNGNTFDAHWYPEHGRYLELASISKDGQYFFMVCVEAIYRCDLADFSWVKFYNESQFSTDFGSQSQYDKSYNNACCFLTGDVFSFLIIRDNRISDFTDYQIEYFFKGPGLRDKTNGPDNKVFSRLVTDVEPLDLRQERIQKDCDRMRMSMILADNNTKTWCLCIATKRSQNTQDKMIALHSPNDSYDEVVRSYIEGDIGQYLSITSTTSIAADSITHVPAYGAQFTMISFRNNRWTRLQYEDGYAYDTGNLVYRFELIDTLPFTGTDGIPYPLTGGWLKNLTVCDKEAFVQAPLPLEITTRQVEWVSEDYLYVQVGTTIYTNRLTDDDIATLTYTYNAEGQMYNKVPTVSYSDTELYLGFGNLIQITANIRDGTDIKFNLPAINDNSFISDITAMINISTSEVALFFKDNIVICTKVADDLLGYRYDYYNTKLSIGVRLGDSVINTLEGDITIFPTRRGLAAMNYQAYMATTDQTLEFITDNIKDRWTVFYDKSTTIKIVQHRSKLYITNGTGEIFIFDFNHSGWWRWQIPINITELMTDQIELKVIAYHLYVFKESDNYRDFPKMPNQRMINWQIQSQPLHMNAPNYYKNLKQLVFQLIETSATPQTIIAQVKLYRKKLTIRDPEVIEFKIEELRTFVKRFNYWKINEVQWGLANDTETVVPAKLKLNGMSVKYELGEEVR